MKACKWLHDTLRNDANDGDECVHCGATFDDPEPIRPLGATRVPRPMPEEVKTLLRERRQRGK